MDLAIEKSLVLFQALPATSTHAENVRTEEKVKLGHILYYDNRLSENNTISCNSCHN
ncbi:MAG: cytochrome-c peroxidase, partial [Flavobacteriales bacterium]|nr:cytochrome-c peroxidase [Flavobacteriales bacterium]